MSIINPNKVQILFKDVEEFLEKVCDGKDTEERYRVNLLNKYYFNIDDIKIITESSLEFRILVSRPYFCKGKCREKECYCDLNASAYQIKNNKSQMLKISVRDLDSGKFMDNYKYFNSMELFKRYIFENSGGRKIIEILYKNILMIIEYNLDK